MDDGFGVGFLAGLIFAVVTTAIVLALSGHWSDTKLVCDLGDSKTLTLEYDKSTRKFGPPEEDVEFCQIKGSGREGY